MEDKGARDGEEVQSKRIMADSEVEMYEKTIRAIRGAYDVRYGCW